MATPIETLLLLATAHIAIVMSPGPNTLIVVQNAIKDRRLGLVTALGVAPSALLYTAAGLFGVGALVSNLP
ncbi:MAG: hypothetical protein EB059_01980 [Alphaproteobacteria bacterium]|nr:hypothetical protein [Alphaproteobacteria bacterium]